MADKIPQKQVEHLPVCPHCEREIEQLHWRKLESFSHYEYIYMCPHCRKVLGIGTAGP